MLGWMLIGLLIWLLIWLLIRMQVARPDKAFVAGTAWSSDRAVLLWGLAIICTSGLALIEANHVATLVSVAALPLVPAHIGLVRRCVMLFIALVAYLLGATALLVAVPAAFYVAGLRTTAVPAVVALASATLLMHHIQSVPSNARLTLHLGSAAFLFVPAVIAAICFARQIGWRAAIFLVGGTAAIFLLLIAGAQRWWTPSALTSELIRTLAVLLPLCFALPWFNTKTPDESERGLGWFAGSAVAGFLSALLIPTVPISEIVFDESHGRWETVTTQFEPNNFGRGVTYTYSLLHRYASQLVGKAATFKSEISALPEYDALFVLKMPTIPLSAEFSARLEGWVRNGGRLLIVADHTDLYDTTQNLNAFLYPRFGIAIRSDAVYDAQGKPNVPRTDKFASLIGRIDAFGALPWQTGASLAAMPPQTVELAVFGPSFSEPGDYSRANRFGPFQPRMSLRYTDHTSVAAFASGSGAVAVILDSTPWSNFSIFRQQYRDLFRGIVHALARPTALKIWGWSAVTLGVIALLMAFFRLPVLLAAGGLALGVALGAAFQIGVISLSPQVEGRDFGLRVTLGQTASLESLKPLLKPGERSFSRIVSAVSKYDLAPSASMPGEEIPNLRAAKKWLLIQPNSVQLPGFSELIAHLRRRGDLTILFGTEQIADPTIIEWIRQLGLYTHETVGTGLTEDDRPGDDTLLNRRGPAIVRALRPTTSALPTSILKGHDADQFFQVYTVRPTAFPRTSGFLSIGFSSDQFSDAAVGDIWEGTEPASIGKLRERQMGMVLSEGELPDPFPDGLRLSMPIASPAHLGAYLLVEEGKTVLVGRFDKLPVSDPNRATYSPTENAVGYLYDLQTRALSFIATSCPRASRVTRCDQRMIGEDMLEWMIAWRSEEDGKLMAVEMMHQKSFSGLGKTVNVVFGE